MIGRHFFITAEFESEGSSYPNTLDSFVCQKIYAIQIRKISGRKFIFKEGDWKIYLTFFPTDEVANEKYALKNKVIKRQHK